MSDTTFTLGKVPQRYQDRVQRHAVLYPLTGFRATEREIQLAVYKLIQQWRARLSLLQQHGWEISSVGNQTRVSFVRNCTPPFAVASPLMRRCQLRQCPFCYARYARDIFLRLDSAYPNPRSLMAYEMAMKDYNGIHPDELPKSIYGRTRVLDLEDDPARFPYMLVERRKTHRFCYGKNDNLQLMLQAQTQKRTELMKRIPNLYGGFVSNTIEAGNTHWIMRQRQILQVPQDWELPEFLRGNGTIHITQCPKRQTIVAAVARACRYPRYWLRGDPDRTATLFNAYQRYNPRITALYGQFRKRVKVS